MCHFHIPKVLKSVSFFLITEDVYGMLFYSETYHKCGTSILILCISTHIKSFLTLLSILGNHLNNLAHICMLNRLYSLAMKAIYFTVVNFLSRQVALIPVISFTSAYPDGTGTTNIDKRESYMYQFFP